MADTPLTTQDQDTGGSEMQLVLAIVQDEDAGPVIEALTGAGFRATRINTVGGFLRKGNATVLV
ncbi:MAG: cyclic-di-AMP receptor, partial [Chloroflexota bacterium]